jgi:hypothetical protein
MNEYGEKTGTYVWSNELKCLVKRSPHPRIAPTFDVYVKPGGYYDEHLGSNVNGKWQPAFIDSKEQKRELMKRDGVVEDGGFKFNPRRKYF